MLRPVLTAFIATLAVPATAGTFYDTSFTYFARDNVADNDNDIIRNTTGLTWETPEGGWRGELSLGARNEFFEGDYPLDVRAAGLKFTRTPNGAFGFGARLSTIEDGESSGELLGFAERYWGNVTGRGLIGLQVGTEEGIVAEDREFSGIAMAELAYYPFNSLAVRSSVALDDVDVLTTIGAEFGPANWPVSLFADWTVAVNSYRADEYYNDFVFGFRITSTFGSLRDRDRTTQMRAIARPVDPL